MTTGDERKANAAYQKAYYHRNKERILARLRERYTPVGTRRRWTDANVLDEIRNLAVDGIAACPQSGSLSGTAARRFGSWEAACTAAGVTSAWRRPLAATAKYSTVHSRLRRERGIPKECEECGHTGPGRRYEWALNLDVVDPLVNELGHPYSLRLVDDYRRLCKPCHGTQDKQR